MKCLLLEGINKVASEYLNTQGLQVEHLISAPKAEDLAQQKDCTALGIRSRTQITKDILNSMSPSLRLIGAFCIGTDQIDLEEAGRLGIPVFNAPYGNTRSVAELVISHIIALSRQSYSFNQIMHQQKWNKTSEEAERCAEKFSGL